MLAVILSLLLAFSPAAHAAGGARATKLAASVGAYFAAPAPDWSALAGAQKALARTDLGDPAALKRLEPLAAELRASADRLLVAPGPRATEAELAAAQQKLAALNEPAFRALLSPSQQARVGAAFWAYSAQLIEDPREDEWVPSKRPLSDKIAGIAAALEASRALPETAVEPLAQGGGVVVEATAGDASKLECSALISAVQPSGFCSGGVNALIERVGGPGLRRQVEAAKPLADGRTILAAADAANKGAFEKVVFVVDGMRRPLSELVGAALRAADAAGLKSVVLPALRTGWNFGLIERTYEQVAAETIKGVNAFLAEGRKSLERITLVVKDNPRLLALLRSATAAKTADPERAALRDAKLSGAGFELAPRPRAAPARNLRSAIHREALLPWDLSRMLTRRKPLRVGTIRGRKAFSKPSVSVLNMPIKMPGTGFKIPAELEQYREFLQKMIDYEAATNPRLDEFYAYLTVDSGYVKKGDTHRRPGIHIDGVQGGRYKEKMPPEHTYSASDAVGTVFYAQSFDLRHIDPDRDYIHGELERQADERYAVAAEDYGIYHWDSYSAHRAAVAERDTPRTFVRVEFSKKVYDNVGDTVNPLFDYDWPRATRAIPYELNWRAEPFEKLRRVEGLDSRVILVTLANGERKTLRVRRVRELAPKARALAKDPAVAALEISSRHPQLWDLKIDYPTAFPEIGKRIEDGSTVEGSKPGGGRQTSYRIDLGDRALRATILDPAKAIAAKPIDDWAKLRELQALVHAALPRDGWQEGNESQSYRTFTESVRNADFVGLGDYCRLGEGACRENALLTVVALRAAGYDARYGYFKVFKADGTFDEDHALALVEIDGTTYVLDSYRRIGRYYNGHRLADLLTPPRGGRYPLASPLAEGNASDPGGWRLEPLPYPKVL